MGYIEANAVECDNGGTAPISAIKNLYYQFRQLLIVKNVDFGFVALTNNMINIEVISFRTFDDHSSIPSTLKIENLG